MNEQRDKSFYFLVIRNIYSLDICNFSVYNLVLKIVLWRIKKKRLKIIFLERVKTTLNSYVIFVKYYWDRVVILMDFFVNLRLHF